MSVTESECLAGLSKHWTIMTCICSLISFQRSSVTSKIKAANAKNAPVSDSTAFGALPRPALPNFHNDREHAGLASGVETRRCASVTLFALSMAALRRIPLVEMPVHRLNETLSTLPPNRSCLRQYRHFLIRRACQEPLRRMGVEVGEDRASKAD